MKDSEGSAAALGLLSRPIECPLSVFGTVDPNHEELFAHKDSQGFRWRKYQGQKSQPELRARSLSSGGLAPRVEIQLGSGGRWDVAPLAVENLTLDLVTMSQTC